MSAIPVVLFKEDDGTVPFIEWLSTKPKKVQAKCLQRIERLAECGHELRRPEADILRDGIYELRASFNHIPYRVLYFFYGTTAVVISHGIQKEDKVPDKEIDDAVIRRIRFLDDPDGHTAGR